MLEAIARKNDELSKIYKASSDDETKNFRKYLKEDPRIAALNKQYRAELTEILNEKVDFSKSRAAAGAKKPVYPKEVQDIINRNKSGAKP
jgi:ABC-type Zn uptake system ZnuABC Zn-binding protein ZnuA